MRTIILAGMLVVSLFSAVEDYRIESLFNGTPIGGTHVRIGWEGPGKGEFAIDMSARMQILFITVPIKRSWRFSFTNNTTITHYQCNSSIDFGNYYYTLYATNYVTNVYVRKVVSNGGEEARWYPRGSYDWITGNQYTELFTPNTPSNRTMRFLDLDSAELYTAEFSLSSNYYKSVNRKKELIYVMTVRSGVLTQIIHVIARNGVPLTMELFLPIIGSVQSRLTNALIEDIPQ